MADSVSFSAVGSREVFEKHIKLRHIQFHLRDFNEEIDEYLHIFTGIIMTDALKV